MSNEIIMMPTGNIKPYGHNPRINDASVDYVANSIQQFGFKQPIVVDRDMVIIAGHTRLKAAKQLGLKEVPVLIADDLTPEQVKAYRLADNKVGEFSMWDFDLLDMELGEIEDIEMGDFGFGDNEAIEFDDPDDGTIVEAGGSGHLSDIFIVPPFSVLDARQGYWQERKRAWRDMGACTTEGRKDALAIKGEDMRYGENDSGTSVFDPVLCEIMYRWFCPDKGKIFDPFAGGIPRGAVAYVKGLDYVGIDLSKEQVKSNNKLIKNIEGIGSVKWINDDALNMDKHVKDETFDFILTCPPYFDLEKYTDDPKDLSNMDYDGFTKTYSAIMANATRKLKNNRFMVVVMSDVRDGKGGYRTLCDLTRKILTDAGLTLYNELIKIDPVGTARLRAKQSFRNRKAIRLHQEVIVFYKGDLSKIQSEFGLLQAEDDAINQVQEDV